MEPRVRPGAEVIAVEDEGQPVVGEAVASPQGQPTARLNLGHAEAREGVPEPSSKFGRPDARVAREEMREALLSLQVPLEDLQERGPDLVGGRIDRLAVHVDEGQRFHGGSSGSYDEVSDESYWLNRR